MEFIKIDHDKLIKEYESGMSLRKLALKYNTSKITIKRKLEKYIKILSSSEWVELNKHKHKKESAIRYKSDDEILRLYDKLKCISDVASELNISLYSVRKCLNRNNINIENIDIIKKFSSIYDKVKPEWSNKENLEHLYNNGNSINDIARKYNYNEEAVRDMFIKLGIDRRCTTLAGIYAAKKRGYESYLETIIKSILDDFKKQHEKFFDKYEYDLLIDNKYLLEINGNYIHYNLSKHDEDKLQHWKDNLSNKYSFNTIWEHEFNSFSSIYSELSKIIKFESLPIKLNELEFKVISNDESRIFYDKYHYRHRARSGYHIAAIYDNNIVCCCTFSNSTRKQSADRLNLKSFELKELIRFAINPRYHNKNLASYCMSKFIKILIKKYNMVKCLLSFAEYDAGHTGGLYKACNWEYDGETDKSYYYKKDDQCWHKKTIWTYAKQIYISENEFIRMFSIDKIITGRKKRFLYWIQK